MRTFFAELRSDNTDTIRHVFFDAPDLQEAMQYLRFYLLGIEECGFKSEIQSIGAYKVKGRKYVRLG